MWNDNHWIDFFVVVAAPVAVELVLVSVVQIHCLVGVAVVAAWAQLEVDEGMRIDELCSLVVVENLGSVPELLLVREPELVSV